MKRARVLKFFVVTVVLAALVASMCFLLCACHKQPKISDIFKQRSSVGEITGYSQVAALPLGWSVYTKSTSSNTANAAQNSDVGYIKSINAFVICDSQNRLSVLKLGDSNVYFTDGQPGMLFPDYADVQALRVKDGLIVCKHGTGEVSAYDTMGHRVLKKISTGNANTSIDYHIKVLCAGLIAVYNGKDAYTPIYRPTTSGELSTRGKLVCRVRNDGHALSYVNGFDGAYVSVVGNDAGSFMYYIPSNGTGEALNPTTRGTVNNVDNAKTNYYSEVTYIGGGRFFVYEDWTVESTENYAYYDGEELYYNFSRHIYTPSNDKLESYTKNSDKAFFYLSNNYYAGEGKSGVDTSAYLNDGYTYASFGVNIDGKNGYYDQYILDSDLNVVMSLTGNYGVTISGQDREGTVGHFDLIMQCTDGYYYNPLYPSQINVYDAKGNRVGHNDRSNVELMELSNNILLAQISDGSSYSSSKLYGAFDVRGNQIIDFKYTQLSSFRGGYTIGFRANEQNIIAPYLIGVDGREISAMSDGTTPFADIAKTSSSSSVSSYIYKIGCYMFQETRDGTAYFGIKNFNPNTSRNLVMPARMRAGSILYAPNSSPTDIFVFDKLADTEAYVIYRLV